MASRAVNQGTSSNPYKNVPPEWLPALTLARKARAYYMLCPYPVHGGFQHWQENKHGPLPRCRPFIRDISQRQAMWLFGKPIAIRSENEEFEEFANSVWALNHMNRRMLELAEVGSHAGTVAIKFSYDEEDEVCPIKLSCLHGVEHCQFFFDPLNTNVLTKARIQFPYFKDGEWHVHREDWTDDEYILYEPQKATQKYNVDAAEQWYPHDVVSLLNGDWKEQKREKNVLGVIPVVPIQHVSTSSTLGEGDMWRIFDLIDQYNFTINLEHIDNQFSVRPRRVYIDVEAPEGDEMAPSGPDAVDVLHSINGQKGDVKLLEPAGRARENIAKFCEELLQQIYDAVGAVMVRPDSITNKGNLTRGVLMQMYARLIESTNMKRTNYGDAGIAILFEKIAKAMQNMGKGNFGSDVIDVEVDWPDIFDATPEEVTDIVGRLVTEIQEGLIPVETAQRKILALEGVRDVDKMLDELKGAVAPNDEETQDESDDRTEDMD